MGKIILEGCRNDVNVDCLVPGETKGSDVLLEAIVEAEVAENAKQFFARPENQIPSE